MADSLSIERAVEEGLLIARAALTMDVKNHLIVSTLRDGESFDRDRTAQFVTDAVRTMALDHLEYRRQMDRLVIDAMVAEGPQVTGHDYRAEDESILRFRGSVYSALSAELDHLAGDAEFIAKMAEAAREAAWAEVGATIYARLEWVGRHSPSEEIYELVREKRMRQLRRLDLADFASTD